MVFVYTHILVRYVLQAILVLFVLERGDGEAKSNKKDHPALYLEAEG
jgi:hypothetical protein